MAKLKDSLDSLDFGTPMITQMLGGKYTSMSDQRKEKKSKKKKTVTTPVSTSSGGV